MKNIKATMDNIMADLQKRQLEEEERWNSLPEEERQRILEERRQQEEAEKKAVLISSYEAKGITPRFFDVEWENWSADTAAKKKAFETVKKAWGTNLFLCGKSGTGKTHLAMCLAKEGATYRRLPDIFREVRSDFDSEQGIIDRYGSSKLLIVDEVGRQKYSDFEKNLFFEIIDKRWNNVLPTTLITNLNEKEFSGEYGTAIVDRLRPTLVRFDWESHREKLNLPEKKKLGDEDIEF
jgi:DNA replication protein DnaC